MPSTTPQDHKKSTKPGKKSKKASQNPSQGFSAAQPIPQVEDPNSKYAATSWGNGGAGGTEDLRVPSGQMCLVRRPGIEGLMRAGVLHNADSLSAIVNQKHIKRAEGRQKEPELDMSSLMADPEALEEVIRVVDKVIRFAVVKPEIYETPNDVTRRVPGVIYTDMVDLVDKMFIFNFVVGGTRDLETFRRGLDQSLGSLDAGEDVPVSSQ